MLDPKVKAAWILLAALVILLGVMSAIAGQPKLPSQDELIRAYTRTPQERISLA